MRTMLIWHLLPLYCNTEGEFLTNWHSFSSSPPIADRATFSSCPPKIPLNLSHPHHSLPPSLSSVSMRTYLALGDCTDYQGRSRKFRVNHISLWPHSIIAIKGTQCQVNTWCLRASYLVVLNWSWKLSWWTQHNCWQILNRRMFEVFVHCLLIL